MTGDPTIITEAPALPDGWRVIATVPNDRVLLIYSVGYRIAKYDSRRDEWVGDSTEATTLLRLYPPTHWQPLPEPPYQNQGGPSAPRKGTGVGDVAS